MNFQETFINLEEFLKTKTVSHNIFRNDVDINTTDIVFPFTPSLKKDEKGLYYCEFYPKREYDIVDNFSVICNQPIEVSFFCGGIYYNAKEFQDFLFVSSPYHELRIRVTFLEEPADKIIINYRSYLLNNVEDRRQLVSNSVRTKYIIYRSGMTYKV